jgi:hypothetical protein
MVKRALILGSANTLREDLRGALSMCDNYEVVIAAKGAALEWGGRLDAWVTLHPDRIKREMDLRVHHRKFPRPDRVYAHRQEAGVTHVSEYKFDGQKTSGSSGHFALYVAIVHYGCDRNVLCGIPLEKHMGRLDGKEHWSGSRAFRDDWNQSLPHIKPFTRSMSGWTKSLLGEPTPSWLES